MKKTIAILLVLVIGMVGVFAADATLALTTTIATLNEFKITQAAIGVNDTHNYSKFTGLDPRTTTEVSRDNGMTDPAFITVANNSTTPYEIGVRARKLAAPDITTTIGFSVTVEGVSIDALEPVAADSDSTYKQVISVAGDATNGLAIASKEITVSIVENDYDSAAAGSYTGYIYFNIKTY